MYVVEGSILNEATGLDATVTINNWTAATGGTLISTLSAPAHAQTGYFSGAMVLGAPAPSENFFEVIVTDKLGNRTTLSPRRLIRRVRNVGNAAIEPSSEIPVETLRRYEIMYTAAQQLSNDTLRFTMPAAWSVPQRNSVSTNGYILISTLGSYTDSIVAAGQPTVLLTGVNLGIGQTLTLIYGDSNANPAGAARPTVNAPLDDGSNTFKVDLMSTGDTQFTAISPSPGLTLTVPVRDSFVGVGLIETGGAPIPKGEETRVLTLRLSNTNVGHHAHRVTQIGFTVEAETGAPRMWRDVATRIVARNTGEGITFADVTLIPVTASITIQPENLMIAQGMTRDVEFWVTISPTALNDTVRFGFSSPAAIVSVDNLSGKVVPAVNEGVGVTGRRTGNYRIFGQAPADTLFIGADTSLSSSPFNVANGQEDAAVMDLVFLNSPMHPDTPSNSIRIDQISLTVRNAAGTAIPAGSVIRGLQIRNLAGSLTYGGVDTPPSSGSQETVTINLSGLTVVFGAEVWARVFVDIVETGATTAFRLRLADTASILARDVTTGAAVKRWDDPLRPENLAYQTDSIRILPKARAQLVSIQPLRTDSTPILGELGHTLIAGQQFFVALCYSADANRSALRVIPADTDLRWFIGGTERTSEFTVSAPAAKTVGAGGRDTFFYSAIQNLGTSAGVLTVQVADTAGPDTRPRLFDNLDYVDPDRLRAFMALPAPTDTFQVETQAIVVSAFALDTVYANAGEESVPLIRFQMTNMGPAARQLDSVAVEAISAGAAVRSVHLVCDVNRNGVFNPGIDTWCAAATLSAAETALLQIAPALRPTIAANGGRETFFVLFNFDTVQIDGDTVDARIPALGVRVAGESATPPSGSLNSAGECRIEVFARRLRIQPDTQLVAIFGNATFNLRAEDQHDNLDNVVNLETPTTQGHNLQVNLVARAADSFADTTHRIVSTPGLGGVIYSQESTVINGYLANGAGQVLVTNTEAETILVTTASVLAVNDTAPAEFAGMISATPVTLASGSAAAPDSRAFNVLGILVNNQSGAPQDLIRIVAQSLNTSDANVTAALLFRDANGNREIDSGVDAFVASTTFAAGLATFNFLQTLAAGDSATYLVGYNLATLATDGNALDARADTVLIDGAAGNIAATPINSLPNRVMDVRATRITLSPNNLGTGTGADVTVTATARDSWGNVDVGYTGLPTRVEFDLTGAAIFKATSTLANQELPVAGDWTRIRGNLVNGSANLVFAGATVETSIMFVTVSPGLANPGTHETGVYLFQQGIVVTPLALSTQFTDPGDTNRVLLAARVALAALSDSINQFQINWCGTDTRSVRNVRLFKDMDANEVFSASDTFFSAPQAFVGETVTFTATSAGETVFIANGTSRTFFLVVDVADTAQGGDTLDVRLLINSIRAQVSGNVALIAIRNSTGHETVARVPDTLAVGAQGYAPTVSEGQTNIVPMELIFSSPAVADRKFHVERLYLQVLGPSGGRVPNSVISAISLRHLSGAPTYVTKTSIESTGDSIMLDIPFGSINPLQVGGLIPETVTIEVVVTCTGTVTHGDTFRLRMVTVDSRYVQPYDHPLGTASPTKLKSNVIVLSPSSLPLQSGVVTLQKRPVVTQQAIRITNTSNVDIESLTIGEEFRIHLGLRAAAGQAAAQFVSADTDLKLRRANGTVDITNEFTILGRTHTGLTDLAAGAQETIVYNVVQSSGFSGAGETLVVNNLLSPETGPFLRDKNSQVRVFCVEDAQSTDAVRLIAAHVNVAATMLANDLIQPDSRGVTILAIRLTDFAAVDTLIGCTVILSTSSQAETLMIRRARIALDSNKNSRFDSGVDAWFGASQDFKTATTLYFSGSRAMLGGGDTLEVYLVIDMETTPVADSTLIRAEVPALGLVFQGQPSLPASAVANTAYLRSRVVATRLDVAPNSQTVAVGAVATLTLSAVDTWGNLNRFGGSASVQYHARIVDTRVVAADTSAWWEALGPYGLYLTGNLSLGAATITLTDTASETVAVVCTTTAGGGWIPGETVNVGFSAAPSVSAVALAGAALAISPDSVHPRILVFDVSYFGTSTTIDSIHVRSENTADTSMKRLRLWADNGDGVFSAATDSNVDTAVWVAGRCTFLVGGNNYVKGLAIPSVRFFVTAEMETSPLVDHDSIGARIETGGVRLTPGGHFPATGELDSVEPDAGNAVIDIDARRAGGRLEIPHPGPQSAGTPFTINIRAVDQYGNHDRIFGLLGSSAAHNIGFSAAPAGLTFNSSSMTQVSGWGGAAPVARLRTLLDTISITSSLTGAIVLTANMTTEPPADTSLTINFVGDEWARFNYSIPAAAVGPGETAVAMSSALRNLQAVTDTITRITVTNIGTVRWFDLATTEVWIDSNANGIFDTGADRRFGTGLFGSGETVAIAGIETMAAGDSKLFFVIVRCSGVLAAATIADTIKVRIATGHCSLTVSTALAPPAGQNMESPESVGIKLRRGWNVSALALLDTNFANGDTGAVIGRISFRNAGTATDTITRIALRDLDGGFKCETDVLSVALWRDTNGNGLFDTGVDQLMASTTFNAADTATFNFSRAVAPYAGETFLVVARIAATTVSMNGDTIRLRYPALQSMTSESGALPPADLTHAESRALALTLVRLSCTQLAIPNLTVSGESVNILVGSFALRNHKTSADTLTSVTIRNDGTQPETGLGNIRLFLDANANGVFNAGVDTPFGAAGTFSSGSRTFSGTRLLSAAGGAGETIGLLVVLDMVPGQAVDSTIIRIRIDTGQIATASTDTAPSSPISSSYLAGSGLIVVRVVVAAGSDSTLLAAGTAIAGETTTVSVSIRDRVGNMARNRTVRLFGQAGLMILSTNPLVTDTTGFVRFTVSAASAGAYRCTVTIDTTYTALADAYANFLTPGSLADNIYSANMQRTTNTGAGVPLHTTAPSFSRTTAGRAAELRLNNTDYSVHYNLLGVPTLLWTRRFGVDPFTLTQPGPAPTSTARVRTVKGVGNDNVVFGAYSSDLHYGVNLYYKAWGAGGNPTRISPNDTRSGSANTDFDADAQFDQFDVHPTGDPIVFAAYGQLMRFHATGASFNPAVDSANVVFLTTLTDGLGNLYGGYQQAGPWIAYPSYSPDGNRIALTVINRADGWPTAGAGSDSSAIYVLRNLGSITPGAFPWSNYATCTKLTSPQFVKVTSEAAIRFAWQPQWSVDGSVLFFSGTTSSNFNYDRFSQTANPEGAFAAAGVDFNSYMLYYDKAGETAPYAPILLNREAGLNELIGEMSSDGAYLGYTRIAGTGWFENRTLAVTNQADINANGGVLFDSGRVTVVIRPNDGHGSGFRIAVRTPDSTPIGSESVIISGVAKSFFRPETPTAPVYFADSVKVILHYQASHFSDTDRMGYDSDGDGIPDRTEAAITAYYWNGTNWIAYQTVRYPAENRIEFWTTHFSTYAAGLSAAIRGEFFTGSVHDVVAYPNPWRIDGPTAHLAAIDDRYGVKLTNFPDGAVRVRIYTLSGELVADGRLSNPGPDHHSSSSAITYTGVTNLDGNRLRGTVRWDLRNQHGRAVASGVYLIVLEGPGGRATRRVAVIR